MSHFKNNNEFSIPEDSQDYYIYKAKNELRGLRDKDSLSEYLAEFILEDIQDTNEDVPSVEVLEQQINKLIPSIIEKAITQCHEEEKSWLDKTDCDKLTEAFSELSKNGIVAKENFTCCSSCGSYEIGNHALQGDYGYVFYHQQDTEKALEGYGIYLGYGTVGLAKKSLEEITEQIVQTIQRHGLKVDWNGSFDRKMFIEINWKKRIEV